MTTTNVFKQLLAAYLNPKVRIIVLRGGTRSGKTWAVLQLLIYIGSRSKRKLLMSVVSETMPHLRKGAMRDFENILDEDEAFDKKRWHGTNSVYSFDKVQLEFFRADSEDKVLGPARGLLYVNEGINITFDTWRALAVRTTGKKIVDYNPAYDFWADEKLIPREDVCVIDSTYLDNDALTDDQIAEIESNRDIDPDWWKVYGLGLKGSKEGLVIKNWDIVKSMPEHFKDEWLGIDFGWSAPTAIMHMRLSEGDIWIDEIAYSAGMDNPAIAKIISDAGLSHLEAICDAAEPKSIAEIKALGVKRAISSDNKDIELGIQVLNRYRKHYTERSLNSIRENRQYRYAKDSDGKYGSIPIKANGHAKDAERYVALNRLSFIKAKGFAVTVGKARK